MELRHLRYFIAVAEEKSFNQAAKRLFISQPPLSRQIKQLEEEVGAVLIDRNQRPLKLTEAGEFFYQHAIQILLRADNLKSLTKRMANIDTTLSIGYVSSVLYGLLPKVIAVFRKTYPNVQLKLHELNSWQQTEALKTGKIDLGIGRLRFTDSSVRRILLREEKLVAALPITHALVESQVTHISLLDLVNENLLLYPNKPRPGFIDYILEIFEKKDLEPHQYTELRELNIALGLVAAGEGVAIVPKTLEHTRRQEIAYLPFGDETISSPLIINIRHFDKSQMVNAFLESAYFIYEQEGIDYNRESI